MTRSCWEDVDLWEAATYINVVTFMTHPKSWVRPTTEYVAFWCSTVHLDALQTWVEHANFYPYATVEILQ